jgi:probable rRNA maturation factor
MAQIEFNTDDVTFRWPNKIQLKGWLKQIAAAEKSEISTLSFVLCSDERLREMNRDHLEHDYYTDILTFDLSEGDELEGEIYISLDRVRENATTFKTTADIELLRVMAHGLLHLLGYNDHSPAEKAMMRKKEDACLSLHPDVPRGTFKTKIP